MYMITNNACGIRNCWCNKSKENNVTNYTSVPAAFVQYNTNITTDSTLDRYVAVRGRLS